MTGEELGEIEVRAAAATPAPWAESGGYLCGCGVLEFICRDFFHPPDRDFILAARSDIPALLEEVRRLRAVLRDVEWSDGIDDLVGPRCPSCSALQPEGHRRKCALTAALGAEKPSGPAVRPPERGQP